MWALLFLILCVNLSNCLVKKNWGSSVHCDHCRIFVFSKSDNTFVLVVLWTQKPSLWVVASLAPIVGGVALASFTEASFNWYEKVETWKDSCLLTHDKTQLDFEFNFFLCQICCTKGLALVVQWLLTLPINHVTSSAKWSWLRTRYI